jgi:hypothetical protein
MQTQLQQAVRRTMDALVGSRYTELAALTKDGRLTAAEIEGAIRDYGRTLISPPTEVYETLDVVPVTGAKPPLYSVVVPLWTLEEGRSDLSLELTVLMAGDSAIVRLDGIHVR